MLQSRFIPAICILSSLSLFPIGGYTQEEPKAQEENAAVKEKDKLNWDFGRVKQGQVLEHGFIVENKSDKELKIKEVNTSCGCTVSQAEKEILRPGESAVIKVKFNSKGYQGRVTQYVYVQTDSLDNPVLRYIIKAEVVK